MKKTFLLLLVFVVTGCLPQNSSDAPNQGQTNMANPASQFCQQQGGKLEIRTDATGGQIGFCVFSDGSECEEWSFYRGECQSNDQNKRINQELKTLFMEKYDKPENEVTVTVSQQTADYARGGVKFGKDGIGEGGIFLAAKVDGEWELVFDGNGIISCALLNQYDFPEAMKIDCIN